MINKKMYNNLKKQEKLGTLSDFGKNLLRDWGKPDIYGPWTEESISTSDSSGNFKFYKSYYLISYGDKPATIDDYESI